MASNKHAQICYKILDDCFSNFERKFSSMNTINEKYGRHITISHKSTKEEVEQAIDKRA